MSAIGPFSIRDALRRELSWTRLPVRRTPILYTACRELPSVNKLGNCQGMLDSSGIKTLRITRLGIDRFATRREANSIVATHEAVTEVSSAVQTIFVAPRKWSRLARQ